MERDGPAHAEPEHVGPFDAQVGEQPDDVGGQVGRPQRPGDEPAVDLRDLLHQLHAAARQVGRTGTAAQIEAAGRLLSDTRRALYLLLAEEPREPGGPDDPGDSAD